MPRRYLFLFAGLILGGAAVLATMVFAQTEPDSRATESVTLDNSDSAPTQAPQVVIPEVYRSDATVGSVDGTPVYFTPQDENSSTTVLFLYSTVDVTQTVAIQTFRLDGSTYISATVDVPPHHLVRVAADTVSTVASSWQDAVLLNFTTSSTYARIIVPAGVKLEGYIAWNDASTYDPLDVVPTLPIRFSTDPPTVFLPSVNVN